MIFRALCPLAAYACATLAVSFIVYAKASAL